MSNAQPEDLAGEFLREWFDDHPNSDAIYDYLFRVNHGVVDDRLLEQVSEFVNLAMDQIRDFFDDEIYGEE